MSTYIPIFSLIDHSSKQLDGLGIGNSMSNYIQEPCDKVTGRHVKFTIFFNTGILLKREKIFTFHEFLVY